MTPNAAVDFAPILVLQALVAAYAAVVYGLVLGRPLTRLLYLLPAAFVGVFLGQFIGTQMQSPGLVVGELHLFEATVGALVLLLIANRLGV